MSTSAAASAATSAAPPSDDGESAAGGDGELVDDNIPMLADDSDGGEDDDAPPGPAQGRKSLEARASSARWWGSRAEWGRSWACFDWGGRRFLQIVSKISHAGQEREMSRNLP